MKYYDFGCKKGSSSELCSQLGGVDGVGLDINPLHINDYANSGRKAILCDITNTSLPSDSADFVCISHVLEHLGSRVDVSRAIQEAIRISKSFVYIVGPWFESDDALKSVGVKFNWSDWKCHPTHVKFSDIINACKDACGRFSVNKPELDCLLFARIPILDTSYKAIHPLCSPKNQHNYDPAIHPQKPKVIQLEGVYREMVAIISICMSSSHLNKIIQSQHLVSVQPALHRCADLAVDR